MTFRIPAKNCNSPAKFVIHYNDTTAGDKNATAPQGNKLVNKDLRIYVSQEEKEPKEGRCDASFFSENVFFVHTNNKVAKTFETSNIYISFYSMKGCSISIRVKFTDPKGHRRARLEKLAAEDDNFKENPANDPFKELRRKMLEE